MKTPFPDISPDEYVLSSTRHMPLSDKVKLRTYATEKQITLEQSTLRAIKLGLVLLMDED